MKALLVQLLAFTVGLLLCVPILISYFIQRFLRRNRPAPAEPTQPAHPGEPHLFLTSDQVAIRYFVSSPANKSSSSPVVVFVHGFPQCSYIWKDQMKRLPAEGFVAVAVEMRGYGESGRPSDVESYLAPRLALDIKELVTVELGRKRATVVGHDWGGAVAWEVSRLFPEILDNLVVINCPHPKAYPLTVAQLLKSWYFFFFQVPYIPEIILAANDYSGVINGLKKDTKKGAVKGDVINAVKFAMSRKGALTGAVNYYRANILNRIIAKKSPAPGGGRAKLEVRTLVVHGMNDRYISSKCLEKLPDLIKDLKIVTFEGVSHWVPDEAPDDLARELTLFLLKNNKSQ